MLRVIAVAVASVRSDCTQERTTLVAEVTITSRYSSQSFPLIKFIRMQFFNCFKINIRYTFHRI